MANAPLTPPILYQAPDLPMRGVPESVLLYGSEKSSFDYLNDRAVATLPGPKLPKGPEDISTFRRVGRFLNTPTALLAATFSPQTSPRYWDIFTQKADYSFENVLRDKGLDERSARYLGLSLDIILDPLNYFTPVGLTKLGRLAQFVTKSEKMGEAVRAAFKGIDPKLLEEVYGAKGIQSAIDSFGIKAGSKMAQDVALARSMGADLEYGKQWWEHAASAQRSLLTFNIPFTSIEGIPVLPKEVSMMAFAIPREIRRAAGWLAERVPVPGSKVRTLRDLGSAMFRRGSGIPLARDLDYFFKNLQKGMEARGLTKIMDELGHDVAQVPKEIWEEVEHAFERRDAFNLATSAMNPEDFLKAGLSKELANNAGIQKVMRRMRDLFPHVLTLEQMAGLKVSQLADSINYITHLISEEGLEALKKSDVFASTPRAFSTNHASMLERVLKNKTIKEVNDLARAGKLEIIPGLKLKGNFFEVGPINIMAMRMHRAARSITGALYMKAMGKAFGKELPSGLALDVIGKLKTGGDALREAVAKRRVLARKMGITNVRFEDSVVALRRVTQAGIGREEISRQLSRETVALDRRIAEATDRAKLHSDALRLAKKDLEVTERALINLPEGRAPGELSDKVLRLTEKTKKFKDRLSNSVAELKGLEFRKGSLDKVVEAERGRLATRAKEAGQAKAGAKRTAGAKFRKVSDVAPELESALAKEARIREELVPLKAQARELHAARAQAEGAAKAEGYALKSSSPYLANYVFKDPAVRQEIDKVFGRMTNIESISDFLKYFDAAQNFWKGMSLAPFPAYHARNYIDNIWRNYLAGVNPVSYFYSRVALGHLDHAGAEFAANRLSKAITTARGEQLTLQEIVNEALGFSVVGNNAMDASFMAKNLDAQIKAFKEGKISSFTKNAFNPRASQNSFIQLGFDFSRKLIEDPARLALYIDRRLKGDTAFDAMMEVKKWLFDYEDLSEFERNVMRRIFPFYSFLRNNLPLQIEQALTQPGKINKIFQFEHSKVVPDLLGNGTEELKNKFLEEWVRNGAPFWVGKDPKDQDKNRFFMVDGYVSTFELQRLFDPGNYFLNQLTPFLREPMSQAVNWDFFFKKPIVSMPNLQDSMLLKDDFLGMSINQRTVHVLRNIRAFNEIDRLIKVASSSPDKALAVTRRVFLGGSNVEVSERKGTYNLGFRLQQIATTGRKEYQRALQRGRLDEANAILQNTLGKLGRGY